MKQNEHTLFLYEYIVNKDRVVISLQIGLVELFVWASQLNVQLFF